MPGRNPSSCAAKAISRAANAAVVNLDPPIARRGREAPQPSPRRGRAARLPADVPSAVIIQAVATADNGHCRDRLFASGDSLLV